MNKKNVIKTVVTVAAGAIIGAGITWAIFKKSSDKIHEFYKTEFVKYDNAEYKAIETQKMTEYYNAYKANINSDESVRVAAKIRNDLKNTREMIDMKSRHIDTLRMKYERQYN